MTDGATFNEQIIDEFRANDGRVGGSFEGAAMLLLTTTGAKSGQPRISPLVYSEDGDRLVIVASNGGSDKHPSWYFNVLATPEVTVEVGAESFTARAAVADGERRRLFDAHAEVMPFFREYEKATDREIPVVILTRANS